VAVEEYLLQQRADAHEQGGSAMMKTGSSG
jgi:hypothetical protein